MDNAEVLRERPGMGEEWGLHRDGLSKHEDATRRVHEKARQASTL